MTPELVSFHVLEKFNNTKLITWSYPSISIEIKNVLLSKTLEQTPNPFVYHRAGSYFLYVSERYTETKCYALSLITKDFNPKKYESFVETMCRSYERGYNPVVLVKIYLGAFNTGCFTVHENGVKIKKDFIDFEAGNINDLIRLFGLEIILIYNALLLKKRVLVYHSSLFVLQQSILSMTHLIDSRHRSPNDYLYPLVRNVNSELKGKSFYLAGLKEKSSAIRQETYDLFINLEQGTISISQLSKDIFVMTKIHKEIATKLVQMEECADSKAIDYLGLKTGEILKNLRSLGSFDNPEGKLMITLESLQSRKLTNAMENFLFNLAVAEDIIIL